MAGVEEGAVVAAGTMVAELYASEELEVRLPLGLEDFGFLKRDENGDVQGGITLKGKIGSQAYEWQATPARVDPEIDRKTLSATLVAKVLRADDVMFPFPPVGLFVDSEIDGKKVKDAVEIPRRALLEGGRVILVDGESKIVFRDVTVVRLNKKTAVVSDGLETGDRVVLTRLSTPVVGMEVKIEEPVQKEEER